MTKVVLVTNPTPKTELGEAGWQIHVPLGLLSLASALRSDGLDAQILDINSIGIGPVCGAAVDAILGRDPDMVGFSTMCNHYSTTLRIARACKEIRPNLKVVFGGPQATITDVETLQAFPFVDCIVGGEGEQVAEGVFNALQRAGNAQGIPGVTTRYGSSVRRAAPLPLVSLDDLPTLDYDLYPHLDLVDRIPIDVGRGCPFSCYFCSTSRFWQHKFRLRPIDSIVSTMRELKQRHGFSEFRLDHDNLTASRSRILALCTAIERQGLNADWTCSARIDCLDEELLKRMASAGCSRIYIGIETGSPRMQHVIGKRLDLTNAARTVAQITSAGMNFTASFMMGFPEEEMADLLQTLDLMLRLRFKGRGDEVLQLHLLAPMPGTDLMRKHRADLRFDGRFSDVVYGALVDDDLDLIARYPGIFAAHYYFDTPNVKRHRLLQLHTLFLNLLFLPYSTYILWKGRDFRFPRLLLDRLDSLDLPVRSPRSQPVQVSLVANFLMQVLNETGFGDHYVLDVIRYELTANRLARADLSGEEAVTLRLTHDVESLIDQIAQKEMTLPPDRMEHDDHRLLFTRRGDQLKTVRLSPSIARVFELDTPSQ